MDNSWHRQGRLFKWLFFTRHAYHILILVVFCFTVVLSNYVPKSSIIPLNLPYVLETFSKYPFSICVLVIKQILMLNRWCVIGPLYSTINVNGMNTSDTKTHIQQEHTGNKIEHVLWVLAIYNVFSISHIQLCTKCHFLEQHVKYYWFRKKNMFVMFGRSTCIGNHLHSKITKKYTSDPQPRQTKISFRLLPSPRKISVAYNHWFHVTEKKMWVNLFLKRYRKEKKYQLYVINLDPL